MSNGAEEVLSPSLRSIPSISSISSNVSLSRRPRTRGRSKTLTGGSNQADVDTVPAPTPYSADQTASVLDKELVDEPLPIPEQSMIPNQSQPRTSRDSAFPDIAPVHMAGSVNTSSVPKSASAPGRRTGYPTLPSAFNRVPLSHLDRSIRDSVITQDSVLTQPTITSSSIYPPSTSTSTASGTDSPPSPRSELGNDGQDVPIVAEEYDGDDVSYRLRLLVNNSYFLPPAHSKPKPSDFAPPPLSLPQKKTSVPTSGTGFLDLFRKPKSKPPTPTSPDSLMPILRTTSDATTTSAYQNQPRSPLYTSGPRSPAPPSLPSSRVVVVREKMPDLASAAKQAEQEMKARGVRQDSVQKGYEDVIDPTDSVDLPPPSSTYPFAVQTSALHGLGVDESVGAALLADRLPPPVSPGGSSTNHDDNWRKDLLKAAVGHSFDNLNSPVISPVQSSPSSGTMSPITIESRIGARIISHPIIDHHSSSPLPKSPSTSHSVTPTRPRGFTGPISRDSPVLARVETPSAPLTPLSPPPRRQIINPIYSLSQTDLPSASGMKRPGSSSSASGIRKTSSSPFLQNVRDTQRQGVTMTPPPLSSSMRREASQDSSNADTQSIGSAYSVDEPRASSSRSEHSGQGSDYSPSPTTSAFHDAFSAPPSAVSIHTPFQGRSSDDHLRDLVSPPPRTSSSLAHVIAPRPSYANQQKSYSDHGHSHSQSTSSNQTEPRRPSVSSQIEIRAPPPTTPPLPSTSMHNRHNSGHLTVQISSNPTPPAIHSAPPPSSPMSFFDSIPSALNYIDFEDSSSEGEDEEPEQTQPPPRPPIYKSPSFNASTAPSLSAFPSPPSASRAPFMRLGNHSTPYVSSSSLLESRPPVEHNPQQQSFFTQRGPLTSTYDLLQYTRQVESNPGSPGSGARSPRRPATAEATSSNNSSTTSLRGDWRRLDGLLKQHVKEEKDRIKQITTNSRNNQPKEQE
ncbi:hypothetical protein VNI00_007963 [Paramarasmius palmivorus]|uniref:Uncharacterized protein n=1 Tax=Paramarasmius palmivorus TaxID=297713 RepID=A0AAW0D0A5_9AGAR